MKKEVKKAQIPTKALAAVALFFAVVIVVELVIVFSLANSNKSSEPTPITPPEPISNVAPVVDKTPPTLTLFGDTKITILKGDSYAEPGFMVIDDHDVLHEEDVVVRGSVDPNTAGEYQVVYSVQDKSGNVAKAERTVIVMDSYSFDTDDAEFYWRSLVNYVQQKGWKVSFGYHNLTSGAEYSYGADQIYYGASLVKTVDALYVYEKMDVTDELRALVKKAITVSDNDAHIKLYKTIGRGNMQEYGRSLGMEHFLDTNASLEYGYTTVNDQLALWQKVYSFLYTDQTDAKLELEGFFNNRNTNSLALNDLKVLHKYGFWDEACHDSGLFMIDQPYIVTVLTNEGRGGFKIIMDLSEKIYRLNELQ